MISITIPFFLVEADHPFHRTFQVFQRLFGTLKSNLLSLVMSNLYFEKRMRFDRFKVDPVGLLGPGFAGRDVVLQPFLRVRAVPEQVAQGRKVPRLEDVLARE